MDNEDGTTFDESDLVNLFKHLGPTDQELADFEAILEAITDKWLARGIKRGPRPWDNWGPSNITRGVMW